ncbi:MAG: hypothetical protein F7C32_00340 [Desulfurococcales archaeon]|nr:hypothetical protein [Desulfurococcales archaeon]
MKETTRINILELIVNGGLIEDLVKWLREAKGYIDDIPPLRSLPYDLLMEYAKTRGLVGQDEIMVPEEDKYLEYEPLEVRPRLQPKRS